MRNYTSKELGYLKQWQESVSRLGLHVTDIKVQNNKIFFYFGDGNIIYSTTRVEDANRALSQEIQRRIKDIYREIGFKGIPLCTVPKKYFDILMPGGQFPTDAIYKALSMCRTIDIDELYKSVRSLDDVISLEETVQEIEWGTKYKPAPEMIVVPMGVMSEREMSSVEEKIMNKLTKLKEKFERGLLHRTDYSVITDALESNLDEGLEELKNVLDFDRLVVRPTLPEIPELYVDDSRKVERIMKNLSRFGTDKISVDKEKMFLEENEEEI